MADNPFEAPRALSNSVESGPAPAPKLEVAPPELQPAIAAADRACVFAGLSAEAELVASALRGHGIPAVLGDRLMGGSELFAAPRNDGVKVHVHHRDVARAHEVLEMRHRSEPAFRMPPRISIVSIAGFMLLFGFLGLAAGIVFFRLRSLGLVGLLGGAYLGSRRGSGRICSVCLRKLAPEMESCAGCGRRIAGEIEHADDRLEAEEHLKKKARTLTAFKRK